MPIENNDVQLHGLICEKGWIRIPGKPRSDLAQSCIQAPMATTLQALLQAVFRCHQMDRN